MHRSIVRTVSCMIMVAAVITSCGGGANQDILGEEYESMAGGFSIKKANGYLFQESGGVISMVAPDAEGELGPMIMIMGGKTDVEKENQALFDEISQQSDVMSFSKGKKLTVGGVKGLIAEG